MLKKAKLNKSQQKALSDQKKAMDAMPPVIFGEGGTVEQVDPSKPKAKKNTPKKAQNNESKKVQKKNRKRVKPSDFIAVWQCSSSVKEVSGIFGLGEQSCSAKAAYYRRKGVPLKNMARGPSVYDWGALAVLAKESLSSTDG